MSLDLFSDFIVFEDPDEKHKKSAPDADVPMHAGAIQTFREKILQRRRQMLVHSYLYYHLDTPIVNDSTWQRWANELRDLQCEFGTEFGFYDDAFSDWTGDTGMHLPRDSWVSGKAMQLYRRWQYETGYIPPPA